MIPVFYATHHGHTAKIAAYLAARLTEQGLASQAWDIAQTPPGPNDLPAFPQPIILIAPIRYGFHLKAATLFLRHHRARIDQGPLTLISVNLVARKEGKKDRHTNVYLRKWLRRHRLDPAEALALAGKLDYPRYGFFDRLMIRLIMTFTRGPTDPRTILDYTPWPTLDALAQRLAQNTKPTPCP